jgi:NADPH-dependent glutamate synthase beta subunit-like oxidoreductase
MACGAKIMLGTEATAEKVAAEKPDAVIIAVGSEPLSLPIPGINNPNVHTVIDVDTGRVKVGPEDRNIAEEAFPVWNARWRWLGRQGVTVVDMIPVESFAKDMVGHHQNDAHRPFETAQRKIPRQQEGPQFTEEGVEVEDCNWRHEVLKAIQ